ncbi:MAG: hypothetical protein V9G12_10000 [Microthrixaceae bacterium]
MRSETQHSKRRSWLDTAKPNLGLDIPGDVMIIFLDRWRQGFFTAFNLQDILANMAILTIIAIGQTYVIISGGIDLSAGWIMGMVAVVAATVMNTFAPKARHCGWSC